MNDAKYFPIILIVVILVLVVVVVYQVWFESPPALKYELAKPQSTAKPRIVINVERGQEIEFRDSTGTGFEVKYTPNDLFTDQTTPFAVPADGTPVTVTVKDDYPVGTYVLILTEESDHGSGELIIRGGP